MCLLLFLFLLYLFIFGQFSMHFKAHISSILCFKISQKQFENGLEMAWKQHENVCLLLLYLVIFESNYVHFLFIFHRLWRQINFILVFVVWHKRFIEEVDDNFLGTVEFRSTRIFLSSWLISFKKEPFTCLKIKTASPSPVFTLIMQSFKRPNFGQRICWLLTLIASFLNGKSVK